MKASKRPGIDADTDYTDAQIELRYQRALREIRARPSTLEVSWGSSLVPREGWGSQA